MIRTILIMVFLVVLHFFNSQKIIAQPRYVTIHEGMRELFLPLDRGIPLAPILYDMNVHEMEDTFYRAKCFAPINAEGWKLLINALRWCAYDTLDVPDVFNLEDSVKGIIDHDDLLVPIGIGAYDYHMYKNDVFAINGQYFLWTDSTIVDAAGPSPFETNLYNSARGILFDLFSASPLVESHPYKRVKYMLDPSFFFINTSTLVGFPPSFTWKIDLGDGLGLRTFDPQDTTIFDITYSSGGLKTIVVQVEHDGSTIALSTSQIFIEGFDKMWPSRNIVVGNVNSDIFTGCNSSGKLIIVVTGFDILGTNTNEITSQNLIVKSKLLMLLNYGYDIAIVEFIESHDGIIALSDDLIEYIEHMKCEYLSDHPFVIFSSSLGGPVVRTTLTRMERQDYLSSIAGDENICNPERMHNTRLWISLEGEMQGANIPMGIQEALKGTIEVSDFINSLGKIKGGFGFMLRKLNKKIDAQDNYDKALGNQTSREMLISHIETRNSSGQYTHHPEFDTTWAQIRAFNIATNGYPVHCKKIALSNGLFDGKRQVAIGNRIARGLDTFNSLNLNTKVRWRKLTPLFISFAEVHYTYRTVPDTGTGTICKIRVVINRVNIKKLIPSLLTGSFITTYDVNVFDKTVDMDNSGEVSVDVINGGRESQWITAFNSPLQPGSDLIPVYIRPFKKIPNIRIFGGFVSSNLDTIRGRLTLESKPVNYLSAISTSRAESFCLVPNKSTFDMVRVGYDFDFESETIDSNLARTPFDVIIAGVTNSNYPRTMSFSGGRPYWHRSVRTTEADAGSDKDITIIAREIGDNYHYLDNRILNHTEMYRCHDSIVAGAFVNPKYDYIGKILHVYDAIQSKSEGFIVKDSGNLLLISTREIILRPGFNVLDSGELTAYIDSVPYCDYSFEELDDLIHTYENWEVLVSKDTTTNNDNKLISPDFAIFPNPTSHWITISGALANFYVELMNSRGEHIDAFRAYQSIRIDTEKLSAGVYYFTITIDCKKEYLKFIKL